MRTFDDMLSKQLENEEFKKEYERNFLKSNYISNILRIIYLVIPRTPSSNSCGKLENGTRNPSINLLKRLADGMGMALKIEFVPKQKA